MIEYLHEGARITEKRISGIRLAEVLKERKLFGLPEGYQKTSILDMYFSTAGGHSACIIGLKHDSSSYAFWASETKSGILGPFEYFLLDKATRISGQKISFPAIRDRKYYEIAIDLTDEDQKAQQTAEPASTPA